MTELGPRDTAELVHGYVLGRCFGCNQVFSGELEAFWRLTLHRKGDAPMLVYLHGGCFHADGPWARVGHRTVEVR